MEYILFEKCVKEAIFIDSESEKEIILSNGFITRNLFDSFVATLNSNTIIANF
jgi:hypothetical protein